MNIKPDPGPADEAQRLIITPQLIQTDQWTNQHKNIGVAKGTAECWKGGFSAGVPVPVPVGW